MQNTVGNASIVACNVMLLVLRITRLVSITATSTAAHNVTVNSSTTIHFMIKASYRTSAANTPFFPPCRTRWNGPRRSEMQPKNSTTPLTKNAMPRNTISPVSTIALMVIATVN